MEAHGLYWNPALQDEDEVNIYLRATKTIRSSVKKSQTVSNLKEMISMEQGISEQLQRLFFSGRRLADNQTFDQCGIEKDSTLDLQVESYERMKIYIKYLSVHRTIVLEPRLTDSIKQIKTMIQTVDRLEPDRVSLIYKGKILKEESTLAYLQVPSDSIIYLVTIPNEDFSVYVKEQNGDTTKLEVKAAFTIQAVKAMVGIMTDKRESEWRLALAGKQLEEHRSLAYYGIKEGTTLDMYPRKFQVFVKTWNGRTVTLDVDQDKDVRVLKLDFVEKMTKLMEVMPRRSARPLKLVCEGKELQDGAKLSSYNIQKDSTIHEN
ncbi:hypothetical protein L6164_025866 [Bauhinia variegata]|uniref:Uncharacterized protein n=1 Tax=Bauhinia variegata TaxID=167791 RepID=A0ACB9M1V6_BAUVA|nr:hypothetical protein L6164_025866 [Bauhinia variegata]